MQSRRSALHRTDWLDVLSAKMTVVDRTLPDLQASLIPDRSVRKPHGRLQSPSADHRSVENVATAAQAPAVDQHYCDAAQNAHFALRAAVPLPASRAEQAGRIGNVAGIEERTKLNGEEAVAVNVLVHLPVRQEIAAAKRSRALAASGGAGVAAQPQIIVALDAELEELVEGHAAQRSA